MGIAFAPLSRLHRHADVAGATISIVCLVHCLATPIVLSLLPDIVPYVPGDAWLHRLLALGIICTGLAGFVPGYLVHRRKGLIALVVAGMSLVLAVAWSDEGLNRTLEFLLSVTGSMMLITAHLLNRSFCSSCRACTESDVCVTTHVE